MKHKQIISSISLCASVILASIMGLGNTVSAEENTTQLTDTHSETFKKLTTSETDVTKASEIIEEAKKDVDSVKKELESSTAKEQETQKAVEQIKGDIQVAKNAEKIIPEKQAQQKAKEQELQTATEQKEKARLELENAQNKLTSAKDSVAKATKAVDTKTEEVKAKQDVVAKTNVTDIAKAVKEQEAVVKEDENTLKANKSQLELADVDVVNKEKTLRDYKPETRTTYVDPSLKEYVDNHPTNVADYKYNKDYRNPAMENVAFTGTKVVTTEITKAQYDQYRQTGKFDYVVDNQKLAESFVKLLNELRELNGVKGNIKADAEFMAYAEARANEMSKNNVLSHDTTIENKPGGAFENAYGSFGAYGQTRIENGKTIISMYEPTTHDSFAYELLLGWYSDYTNATGANYGHRRALLTPVGQKFGLAVTTKPGSKGNDFTALEMQTYEPEYEYEDGEKYTKTTPESEEFWKNYTGFNQDDKLNPTFNGKKMKFIAEHTFLFTVTEIVNDQTANLQAALDQAKAKRNALATKKSELENKVASSTAKLSDLKSKAQNLETALTNAKAELATAQSELMVLKEDKDSKVQLLKNTQRNFDATNTKVESASVRISEVQNQLNQVKDELAKVQEFQSKLPELEKSLLKAETIKDKAIETRKSIQEKLVQAQNQLTKVTVEYNRVKTLYDLEKTLNLYQGDKETIAGIPNNSPEVPTLPEFDINTLAKPEQPTNPVINNVSVKPLPTNNDKPTRVDSLATSASNRETTNEQKTLPNTGSFSRVERQMALGGYTALGLSLGLLGFAMRRKRKH
ncbi:CAP domain-containing protein [Streptococcus infantis]|uniref:CAP domain-containing protein n=1 Tax=Streptococcus infantis TaxID=68892 RepID=UPI0039C3081C